MPSTSTAAGATRPPVPLVDAAARQQFHTLGYLHLPGVFDAAEIDRLSSLHDHLIALSGAGPQQPDEFAVAAPLVLVDDYLPFFDHDGVSGLADALLGEDCVYYTDGAITHPKKSTAWHQDGPNPFLDVAKISIYLDPVDIDTGCLVVLPGSHHPDASASYAEAFRGTFDPDQPEISGATALPSQPGDVQIIWRRLWHSTWARGVHRRQFQINFSARPTAKNYDDESWHWQLKACALDSRLWRSGYRLFSEEFIATAGARRLRKVQPYLDAGFNDPTRPAPTEADLEVFRRP